jgi:hypothetical protein
LARDSQPKKLVGKPQVPSVTVLWQQEEEGRGRRAQGVVAE